MLISPAPRQLRNTIIAFPERKVGKQLQSAGQNSSQGCWVQKEEFFDQTDGILRSELEFTLKQRPPAVSIWSGDYHYLLTLVDNVKGKKHIRTAEKDCIR